MTTVKMAKRAILISSEHRDRRVLISLAIFAAKIVLESALACAQQTQSVPTSFASIRAQRGWIRRGDNRQIHVLRDVMSDAIVAIDPGSAHWARIDLLLSKHEVINHQRTIRRGEQFAQTRLCYRLIAIVERPRTFKKLVVLNRRALWQSSPKFCDSFTRVS